MQSPNIDFSCMKILILCCKSQTAQNHYMLSNNNSIQFYINVASPEQSGQ